MKLDSYIGQTIKGFVEGLFSQSFFRILVMLLIMFIALGFTFFLLSCYFDVKSPEKKKKSKKNKTKKGDIKK